MVLEHGPGIESCEGILSACKNTPRKQDKDLETSVSSKSWNYSWNVFVYPSQVYCIEVSLFQIFHYYLLLLFN